MRNEKLCHFCKSFKPKYSNLFTLGIHISIFHSYNVHQIRQFVQLTVYESSVLHNIDYKSIVYSAINLLLVLFSFENIFTEFSERFLLR